MKIGTKVTAKVGRYKGKIGKVVGRKGISGLLKEQTPVDFNGVIAVCQTIILIKSK